jgi:cytidylate kinase
LFAAPDGVSMPVVTICGSQGSGARDIARLAAAKLGIDYVDQEILVKAARALGVSVDAVERRDERASSFGERLAAMLRRVLERSAAASAADPTMGSGGLEVLLSRTYGEAAALPGDAPQELSDSRYIETLTTIIKDLAERGDILVVGRGSQVILRERPDALHVSCTAPFDSRVRAIAVRDGVSEEEATRTVQDSDKNRAAFHRKYFKVNVDDPCLYDLVIGTARFSQEEVAELICAAGRCLGSDPGLEGAST